MQLNRREWIGCSLSSLACLALPKTSRAVSQKPPRLLTIVLTGGPGHLDTFDLKPNAPSDIRGPFRPIPTTIPGLELSEHFPRLARLAHTFTLVHSMSAPGPQIHDLSGYGDLLSDSLELFPGPSSPRFPLINPEKIPTRISETDRQRYGRHHLGRNLLLARALLESGTPRITVHHFAGLLNTLSWDMHADGGDLNTTFQDYAHTLCPQLDQSLSALLTDLQQTGLLQETNVAVISDMGRTPRLNSRGGRDHHKNVWTNLVAGPAFARGTILGASDPHGYEPRDLPLTPSQFAAYLLPTVRQPVSPAV